MNTKVTSNDVALLQKDEHYYGELGDTYMSCSKVSTLINNPKAFLDPTEQTLPMFHGSYVHHRMLEPEKADAYDIIEASTRNTKVYKEALAGKDANFLLLLQEKIMLDDVCQAMKDNINFYDAIYDPDNLFEVAKTKEIMGVAWKAKADILGTTICDDIKTTSDITGFMYTAKRYNYDVRAYIYREIFDLPHRFLVVDKKTLMLGMFDCEESFYESGRIKVEQAMENFHRFYGAQAYEDVSKYYLSNSLI